jgi:PAS domain S-box-containing protein
MQLWPIQLLGASASDEPVNLRIRLFRLFCLTACGLCLGVVLPINLFQNLPLGVNVTDVLVGLTGGFCYWASRRGRDFFVGFFVVLMSAMNPIWFLNAGADGSLPYYFFVIVLYPVAIFRGWLRRILVVAVILDACGLLVFEYFFPRFTVPFQSRADRVIDLTTGAVCSCLALVLVLRFILVNYERERAQLERSKEELAASEQNYREIFNGTSDALIIRDLNGGAIDANERMCSLYGCDRETVLRLSIEQLSLGVSPYSRKEAGEKMQSAIMKGPQVFVWRSKRVNGELFWSEVALRAGEIAGEKRVIVSVRDIDYRIQEEEALRLQEERLRLTLEASNQGWFDINVQTGEGRASAEYARILGLPPEDFKASVRDWMDGVHADDRESAQRAFRACVATGETHALEYRRKAQSGEWKWIRSVGKIVEFDADGKAARMVGTHTDITERKALEARLLHSQRLESVATLAGGVAHDLNNILTPMLMASSVLQDKLADARDRELLASLESGARRGALIVRQLLGFSESLAETRVRINVAQLVRESSRIIRASFPPTIFLVEQLPPDLWAVTADPEQLRQVLDNLCTNAREAMPLGGTLTLSAANTRLTQSASTRNPWSKVGAFVMIAVSDTGRGIPREIIGRIFDPFFTTKQVGEGSGLGLSTVHGIVNGQGGSVTVESEPGLGATFKVFLPAQMNPVGAAAS